MQLVINPKGTNTFATASLDKTIKVWYIGRRVRNFTLEGHDNGVSLLHYSFVILNLQVTCVDYYKGGDKPYLISGANGYQIKIWDYLNKTCVATLCLFFSHYGNYVSDFFLIDGHTENVSAVCFHPNLPIIVSTSEDSTVCIWNSNSYK